MSLENKIPKEKIKEGLMTSGVIGFGLATTYFLGQAYIKFFQEFGEALTNYLNNYTNF